MGFDFEPEPEPSFIVLHDNWDAWLFYVSISTQWRIGMQGATGLDYTAVIAVIKLNITKRKHQQRMLENMQLIERGIINQRERNGKENV